MQLSNRSFQNELSRQLAEAGIEEALRAFNKNDWGGWASNPTGLTGGTTAWTLDTTNKRASRTITLSAARLGQGATATIKLRVDNYDANVLGATYSTTTTYRINDLVGSAGIWYRSLQDNNTANGVTGTGSYPNLAFWASEPALWKWSSNRAYVAFVDIVNYNGAWYRCTTSHTSVSSFTAANWTAMNSSTAAPPVLAIYTNTYYPQGTFAFRIGGSVWLRCNVSHTVNASWDATEATRWDAADSLSPTSTNPAISWAYRAGATYNINDIVFYSGTLGVAGTWYRCKVQSTVNVVPTNTTNWENLLTGSMHAWVSTSNYNIGDVVYYSSNSQWYRCIRAHSGSSINPSNTTYWSNTPAYDLNWQPNRQYSTNDVVRYKGIWFLALANNNGQIPMASSSASWAAAPLNVTPWSATATYELDDIVSSSGTWYRCIRPHTAQSVTSTSYWTPLTGAGSSYQWSAGTAYSVGQYRSYGGAWYRCTTATSANDGRSPNNTSNWTPTWTNGWGVTTGAPIAYAEATVTLGDRTTTRTQLRALLDQAPLFASAAASSSTITSPNAGTVDSYDGSVWSQPATGSPLSYVYSTDNNTPFNSSTNPNVGNRAVVSAAGTSFPSISLTSTAVKGYAATASNSSGHLVSVGSSGSVKGFSSAATPNVDPTRVSRSAFVPTFSTQPSAGLTSAFSSNNFPRGLLLSGSGTATTVTLGVPGSTVPARYYTSGSLTISDTAAIQTLNIVGPVILYINGSLTLDGDGTTPDGVINITNSGSLELHVAQALQVNQNSAGINNLSQDPKRLVVICDSTSTSAQYYHDGGYPFYGVIYAPNTTASNGLNFGNTTTGSPTTRAIYGAVNAAKIVYSSNNNMDIHYDTSLRYMSFGGIDQVSTTSSFLELATTEAATMP